MPSYEALAATEAAIWKRLGEGAEARLRAIPGVVHVSVGAKERGGKFTREMCIRVYVAAKRPLESIPPRDHIPREIDGVPTDVNAVTTYQSLEDTSRRRPVKGGIAISNKIPTVSLNPETFLQVGYPTGTFGCTATRRSNHTTVLLSNAHVLMASKAQIGYNIFQPANGYPSLKDPVPPPKDDDMIAKIVDWKHTVKVDAAIAELDVSSCCRCCCGVDFRDEIAGLSKDGHPPSNKIVGMRRPVPTKDVFKVGIRTGRTEGLVVDPHAALNQFPGGPDFPTLDLVDQISIGSLDETKRFADEGDSGSVVIDDDGWIVGLVFGSDKQFSDTHKSYANNIVNVCDALQIDINLTMPGDSAGSRIAVPAFDAAGRLDEEAYAAARARVLAHPMAERVLAHPAGAWLFALGETHRDEVIRLVTTHRPVTLAWHRAGGPALFATGLESFRAGRDTLPAPTHGGTLEAALAQVGNALAAHGSPALRDAIGTHREELLGAVRDSATVHEVLRKLSPAVLTDA